MFWLGLIGLILFLVFACDMSLGAVMLWVCLYCIIGGAIDFAVWNRRRRQSMSEGLPLAVKRGFTSIVFSILLSQN